MLASLNTPNLLEELANLMDVAWLIFIRSELIWKSLEQVPFPQPIGVYFSRLVLLLYQTALYLACGLA
jgi:hypothetical protein